MKEIKDINIKINEYLENRKEEKERFHQLDETLKKRTQAHYINEVRKDKKTSSKKRAKPVRKSHRKKQSAIAIALQNLEKRCQTFSQSIDRNIQNTKKKVSSTFSFTEVIKKKVCRVFSIKPKIVFKKPQLNFKIRVPRFSLKNKLKYILAGSVGVAAITIATIMVLNQITAYKVTFHGHDMGIVKDPESVLYLAEIADDKLDIAYNADIIINQDNIAFEKIRGFGLQISTDDEILNHFTYFSNLDAKAYAIHIGNEQIAVFSKKDEAEHFLEEVKEVYIDKDNEHIQYDKIYFLEDVEIKETETTLSTLSNYEKTLSYVLKGTNEEKLYKVKKGENYWTIADKFGITPEELEDANPSVNPERLQIGQEISLIVPKPLITVVSLEKVTFNESIPFEIEYENTGALFKGETDIRLSGKKGKKEVLAEVERHNGIEVSRKEIESKVIEEPRTQVVLVGTKALPPLIGTGTFDNPTRGTLTSRFGTRWGRMHTGIDVAGPVGTAIRASDGGVVTYTGWKGNYGLAVMIDHGQNKVTLYAHCNKILVKTGDKVYKGQKVAEMGNTGNSTGPHLHFEVRINGKAQNPLNYVRY